MPENARGTPSLVPIDVLNKLNAALEALQAARPNERGEYSRRYAVTITEMEKVMAYFYTYIYLPIKADDNDDEADDKE